jgi:hypothetical protein
VIVTGPGIRHVSCGARVPVTDPGPSFSVAVDVFQNGVVWGTYSVRLRTLKTAWLDPDDVPPAATCGLNYTLSFSIDAVVALGGNASVSPSADTGDPALVDEGVGAIVAPADGAVWGSDS